jgi:tRNA (cmo5U34)-methyltransferase
MSGWSEPEHAGWYLAMADRFPHRSEGEAVLLEQLPAGVRRVLDLGTGDGRLAALVIAARPGASVVGLDMSPPMLERARVRFAREPRVEILDHNLVSPLPRMGAFDAVVSSFAIHHLENERKLQLFSEVKDLLKPGGVFCNLEHVASPTPRLHERFRRAMGIDHEPEDPTNRCLDVQTQLAWLEELGFEDVDCHWKWLELALLCGTKPGRAQVP